MIWENKNAFFEVAILADSMTKDVISLEIAEEVTKTDDVSITLNDPLVAYDNLLTFGKEVTIQWGVRGIPSITRVNKGFVTASNNSGDDKGHVTTQITMQTILDMNGVQIIHTGTRKHIVETVMSSMGITQPIVDFWKMDTVEEQITQYENNFAFLVRLAREWGCHFRMAHDQAQHAIAAFCSAEQLSKLVTAIGGGSAIILNYGFTKDPSKVPNVISYTKNRNPVGSGGQGAMTSIVNNKSVLTRFIVEGDSVITWKLNTEKCVRAINELGGGTDGLQKLWDNYLSPNRGWETAKRFYTMVSQDTASESMGYTVTCELIGNPSISAGSMIYFGAGFSDDLGATNRVWWVRKARHSFSHQGYRTSIEVVDSRQMSDAGAQIPEVMNYILEEAKAL
ncbi:MAG: hypothetical protein LBP19_05345 [Treponema sp.]|jgi:phage protein D|nr:hypothetical protein [Treponema sp.]